VKIHNKLAAFDIDIKAPWNEKVFYAIVAETTVLKSNVTGKKLHGNGRRSVVNRSSNSNVFFAVNNIRTRYLKWYNMRSWPAQRNGSLLDIIYRGQTMGTLIVVTIIR
jgi:hypothetical protein